MALGGLKLHIGQHCSNPPQILPAPARGTLIALGWLWGQTLLSPLRFQDVLWRFALAFGAKELVGKIKPLTREEA